MKTKFAKSVEIALIEQGKSKKWLIYEIKDKTGLYVDYSNLDKIFKGTYRSKRIVGAICEILNIPPESVNWDD